MFSIQNRYLMAVYELKETARLLDEYKNALILHINEKTTFGFDAWSGRIYEAFGREIEDRLTAMQVRKTWLKSECAYLEAVLFASCRHEGQKHAETRIWLAGN